MANLLKETIIMSNIYNTIASKTELSRSVKSAKDLLIEKGFKPKSSKLQDSIAQMLSKRNWSSLMSDWENIEDTKVLTSGEISFMPGSFEHVLFSHLHSSLTMSKVEDDALNDSKFSDALINQAYFVYRSFPSGETGSDLAWGYDELVSFAESCIPEEDESGLSGEQLQVIKNVVQSTEREKAGELWFDGDAYFSFSLVGDNIQKRLKGKESVSRAEIFDVVETPKLSDGVKPYLFSVLETIDGNETLGKTVEYTSEPRLTAKEIAFQSCRDVCDDCLEDAEKAWDSESLSLEMSTLTSISYREITPAQAEIFLLAEQI